MNVRNLFNVTVNGFNYRVTVNPTGASVSADGLGYRFSLRKVHGLWAFAGNDEALENDDDDLLCDDSFAAQLLCESLNKFEGLSKKEDHLMIYYQDRQVWSKKWEATGPYGMRFPVALSDIAEMDGGVEMLRQTKENIEAAGGVVLNSNIDFLKD